MFVREGVASVRPLSKKAARLAAGRDAAVLDMKRARWYTTGRSEPILTPLTYTNELILKMTATDSDAF